MSYLIVHIRKLGRISPVTCSRFIMNRREVISLYKSLLRYAETVKYSDSSYLKSRIRQAFQSNKFVTDEKLVEFLVKKGQAILELKRIL
ncbi:hypothetical protein CRM22_003099 [Opisthorchis felineus]|uniref:Complex 1 LYR protein domain-containing protein n=1 Tax=Opisthorchis felineus TaxID=147828 RepID=A0A4S2M7N0_OPIFE|nr:hypothetical protein CRM22_003099 [Opisthorchis felineus]